MLSIAELLEKVIIPLRQECSSHALVENATVIYKLVNVRAYKGFQRYVIAMYHTVQMMIDWFSLIDKAGSAHHVGFSDFFSLLRRDVHQNKQTT